MHTINVEYCTKLFKKETIENLFEHYLYMLTDIIENVDAKIKDIDIITPKENKLLEKFNATDGEIK